jgi:hypothetical protein
LNAVNSSLIFKNCIAVDLYLHFTFSIFRHSTVCSPCDQQSGNAELLKFLIETEKQIIIISLLDSGFKKLSVLTVKGKKIFY